MPWRKLLITTAAFVGMSGMAAVNADAASYGASSSTRVSTSVHSTRMMHNRADFRARAQVHVRGPDVRPPGWSHGRKTGWHCTPGRSGCMPPGLR